MEILADALAQIARLADVNDRAEPVPHQIDARFVGERAQFFADGFSRRHGKFQRKTANVQRNLRRELRELALIEIALIREIRVN